MRTWLAILCIVLPFSSESWAKFSDTAIDVPKAAPACKADLTAKKETSKVLELMARYRPMMEQTVTVATDADLEAVLNIQRTHLLSEKEGKLDGGFVRTVMTIDALKELQASGAFILVAKKNGEVVGYSILLTPQMRVQQAWFNGYLPPAWDDESVNSKVWYYKQTAVLESASRLIPVLLFLKTAEITRQHGGLQCLDSSR